MPCAETEVGLGKRSSVMRLELGFGECIRIALINRISALTEGTPLRALYPFCCETVRPAGCLSTKKHILIRH